MTQTNPIALLMFGCGGCARRYHVQPVLDAANAIRLARRADGAGRLNPVPCNRRFDASCLRARDCACWLVPHTGTGWRWRSAPCARSAR